MKNKSKAKSTAKPGLGVRGLALLKKPVFWIGTLALGALATAVLGVFTPFAYSVVDKVTRPEPVSVSDIRITQNGATHMAFPREIQISRADAAEVGYGDDQWPWFESKGGVLVGDEFIRLTVTGNRTSGVKIMGVTPVKECHDPLTGAYFESQSAGGSPSLTLSMNMDDPSPQARSTDTKPYFSANTVDLKKDEQFVFELNVSVQKSYCTFELELSVLEPGSTVRTQRIDNHGKPFSLTAQLPPSAWESAYIAGVGVMCNRDVRGNYVPATKSWLAGGADMC